MSWRLQYKIKSTLKSALAFTGIRLARKRGIQIGEKLGNVSAIYSALLKAKGHHIVMEIPTNKCRVLHFNRMKPNEDRNPWFKFIVLSLQNNQQDDFCDVLRDFYKNNAPKNASDYLNLPHNKILSSALPEDIPLPWQNVKQQSYAFEHKENIIKEAKQFGFTFAPGSRWYHTGPATEERIQLEASRLLSTAISIKDNGYVRTSESDGDITGELLIDERSNVFCVHITGGMHRTCALGALGYTHIPIRLSLDSTILRSNASNWRQVKDKVFSEADALKTFDQFIV